MLYGDSGYSVISSRYHGDGQNKFSSMGNSLWSLFRADGGYSDGSSCGEGYGCLEVCAPGCVSNGRCFGNIGGNIMEGVLGADSGS